MKRDLYRLATALFSFLWLIAAPQAFAYGAEADFVIKDERDLLEFADNVKNNPGAFQNKVVRLAGDIQFPEGSILNFTPIKDFRGTFDGCGYSISGIDVAAADTNAGLFASASGTIKNLTVKDSNFQCQLSSSAYTGAIVGDGFNATIINCHNVNTSVSASRGYLGGVAGRAAVMVNCSSSGMVTHEKSSYVGGVAGYVKEIYNSYHLGTVEMAEEESYWFAGGVAGDAGKIVNCYNAGAVTTAGKPAAGIAGYVEQQAISCYNNADTSEKQIDKLGNNAVRRDVEQFSSDYLKSDEFLNQLNTNRGGNQDWLVWEFSGENSYPRHIPSVRLSDPDIKAALSQTGFSYNGREQFPKVNVEYRGEALKEGRDFSLSYRDNVEPGTAVVFVEGCGRYIGSLALSYEILPLDISTAQITLSQSSYVYDGTRHRPSVSVSINGQKLYEDDEYETAYQNNVNAGTASVVLTGLEPYCTGTAVRYFTIAKRAQSVSVAGSYTTEYKADPFYISAGGNVAAAFQSSNPGVASVNASTGLVNITGIGRTVITVTVPDTVNYAGKTVQTVVTVKPRKQTVKISSVRKKAMTVKWMKEAKASGYQIEYSTTKNFKSNVKTVYVKTGKASSKKITKLKTGKRYYVRVRAYKDITVHGRKVTINGAWSSKAGSGKIK